MVSTKPPLHVLIAAPRGFCAGVDRAIKIVELAIERFGPPVYVRHEIVHNRFVVDRLRGLGAVFVKELDEVPDGRPVVFSAHGVPKIVPAAARARGLDYLDATCPLVSKVHRQAERLIEAGRHIIVHRPRRPPGSDRHLRPGPAGQHDSRRDGRGRRRCSTPRAATISPSLPRPRCRSTTRPRSSRRCRPVSRRSLLRAARTFATPLPTARRRSRRSRRNATGYW